jgi:DNA-binding CsgD family transcriptional regulator
MTIRRDAKDTKEPHPRRHSDVAGSLNEAGAERKARKWQRIDEAARLELVAALGAAEFQTEAEVRDWLRSRFNVRYSSGAVSQLLKELGVTRKLLLPRDLTTVPKRSTEYREVRGVRGRWEAGAWFERLLSETSTNSTYSELQTLLKEHLLRHLSGVATVCVDINYRAAVTSIAQERATVYVTSRLPRDPSSSSAVQVSFGRADGTPEGAFLDRLIKAGFPRDRYNEHPHVEIYELDDGGFLGAVALWSAPQNPPVSGLVVQRLKVLQPYVRWTMLHISAIRQSRRPMDQWFYEVMDEITREGGLTEREMEVAFLRMGGLEVAEIARKLDVSVHTIQTHLKNVFDKTGAGGVFNLHRKYFAPKLTEAGSERLHQTGDVPGESSR